MISVPLTIWGIAAAAMAGVVFRPFSWPEFIWALAGAALLVLLMPPALLLALASVFAFG